MTSGQREDASGTSAAPEVAFVWRKNVTPWLLSFPVLVVVLLFVAVPTGSLLIQSLQPAGEGAGGLTLDNYWDFYTSKASRQASLRTLRVSLITTAISILAGYPIAYFLSKTRSRLRPLLLAIVLFPLMVSVIVRAYGWSVVLGRTGLVNVTLQALGITSEPLKMVNNEIGVIVGITHLLLPYMVLALMASMQRISPNLEEAAQSLGAPPWQVFLKVVFPLSLPGLLSGILLVFSLSVMAFATPMLLGGGRALVLTTLLSQYAFASFDWIKASTVGVILLILGIIFIFVHRNLSARSLRSME
jgi:putative spermidine/putrescine transport system permease protein